MKIFGWDAFVYCWRNLQNGKRYIGAHKGTPDDGYVCSSSLMLEDYGHDPKQFSRQILAVFDSYIDALGWEAMLCDKVDAVTNPKFYNRYNGHGKWYNNGHSKKTRRKIGRANTGNKPNQTSFKIGHGFSHEVIAKIKEARARQVMPKWSEERRAKYMETPQTDKAIKRMAKPLREIAPLNELSKKTLGSYIKGAAIKHMEISDDEQEARRRKEDVGRVYDRKRERVAQGVGRAVTRLVRGELPYKSRNQRKWRSKPYQFKEENINELSKRTLGNYIQTATGGGVYPSRIKGMSQLGGMLFNKRYSKKEREGVSHFAGNRRQGIDRATERLTGEKKGYKFK